MSAVRPVVRARWHDDMRGAGLVHPPMGRELAHIVLFPDPTQGDQNGMRSDVPLRTECNRARECRAIGALSQ